LERKKKERHVGNNAYWKLREKKETGRSLLSNPGTDRLTWQAAQSRTRSLSKEDGNGKKHQPKARDVSSATMRSGELKEGKKEEHFLISQAGKRRWEPKRRVRGKEKEGWGDVHKEEGPKSQTEIKPRRDVQVEWKSKNNDGEETRGKTKS